MDLENPKGEETGEGGGNGLSGVEEGETAGEFAAAVKPDIISIWRSGLYSGVI